MQVTIQIKNVNQIEALKALFLAGQAEPVTPTQPVAKPVPVAEQAPVPVEPTATEAVAPAPVKKGRSRSTKDTLPPPPVAVPTEQEFVTNKVEEAPKAEVAKPVAPATKEPATAPKAEAKPVEATVQSSYEDVKKAFIQVMKAFGSEQDVFKKWMMDKFGITNGKELTPDRYTEALLIAEQTIKEVKGEATAEDFM